MPTLRLTPESGELLHLDALRFIAATAIVVTHSQGMIGFRSDGFGIFVDLFFVISGFVIAFRYADRMSSWADYRNFLWRRVARLGPLHWATLAAFVAIGVAVEAAGVHINNPEAFDMRCIPANALLLHATSLCPHYSFNGPSWSVSAEAMVYLAAPAIFLVMRKPLSAIISLAGMWVILTLTTGTDWLSWTVGWGAVRPFPSFVLGVGLFYQRHWLAWIPFANAVYLCALLALLLGAAASLPHIWLLGLAYLAVIGGTAAGLGGRSHPFVTRLAPLGQLTYSVYMLHMLVLTIGNFVATRTLGLEGGVYRAFLAGTALGTFPLACISLATFEGPARRWLVKLHHYDLVTRKSLVDQAGIC